MVIASVAKGKSENQCGLETPPHTLLGVTGLVQAARCPHQPQDTEGEVSLLPHLVRRDLPTGGMTWVTGYESPSVGTGGADSLVVGIPACALSCQLSGMKIAPSPVILTEAQVAVQLHGLVQDHGMPDQEIIGSK